MKFDKRVVLKITIATSLIFSHASYAQVAEQHRLGPRKQLATIVFAGLGGAILGLSTLSFYGRPQDKLTNIAYGFAVGVIVGTIYVTYRTAAKPKEYYNYGHRYIPEIWEESPRLVKRTGPLYISHKFEF